MKGHTGTCHTVKRFRDEDVEGIAHAVQAEYQDKFAPHGARLSVRPIRISHLSSVGDGVMLDLNPFDAKSWPYWGEFESDIEVRRRARFSRAWDRLMSPADVEHWLRRKVGEYLARLAT